MGEGDADLAGATGAEGLDGAAMGQEEVVRGEEALGEGQPVTRGENALVQAEADDAGRLVDGDPVFHAVAIARGDERGVVAEPPDHVAIEEAAATLEGVG